MFINKSISLKEIFDRVASHTGTIEERAALLRAYQRHDVRWVTQYIYSAHEAIPVPEFKYSNQPSGVSYSSLNKSVGRINSALQLMKEGKVEVANKVLTLVLESIPNEEADLLVSVLKGHKIEGVSKAVFKRAFPEYFPRPEDQAD